ncbi:MAG: hypothetical protein ACI8YQ_001689 [Polaribacter sp.]|jgi:hypothetical protein
MKFISESQIDQVTDILQSEADQEAFFRTLGEDQPIVLSFLVSEDVKVLTLEEQELMYLLAAILYKSILNTHPDCPMIDEDILGKAEEQNWALMEANIRGTFSERITPFFENYPQEDLLAFVEDALVFDEDSQVTNEGRSYLFVVLKSMIDAFEKVAK